MSLRAVIAFCSIHILAIVALTAALCLLWLLFYFLLLLIAALTDGDIGGPLALPMGLFLLFIGSLVVGFGIFAPACAFGAVICRSFKWPRLAAIPIVFVCGAALTYLACLLFIAQVTTTPIPPFETVYTNYLLFLAVPLGAYWWLTEIAAALPRFVLRLVKSAALQMGL